MSGAAVNARDLGYRYPDGREAISGVSFQLATRESLGVIGPNGAGKTTLFHLLAGLLRPSHGTVEVFEKSYGNGVDQEIRRHLGFVFQETEDQLFSPTVFDDVAFGPLNFGLSEEETRERVGTALRLVGLDGYEERVPHHLSSGERRRVAIATVLSYEPDVLILDEPSSDLDPRGRRELVRLLATTSQARLVASHDLELILRTCDRVLLMDGGSVRATGRTTDVICDHRLLERHGLEPPLGMQGLTSAEVERLLREDRR